MNAMSNWYNVCYRFVTQKKYTLNYNVYCSQCYERMSQYILEIYTELQCLLFAIKAANLLKYVIKYATMNVWNYTESLSQSLL